jgi:hypothetical protein
MRWIGRRPRTSPSNLPSRATLSSERECGDGEVAKAVIHLCRNVYILKWTGMNGFHAPRIPYRLTIAAACPLLASAITYLTTGKAPSLVLAIYSIYFAFLAAIILTWGRALSRMLQATAHQLDGLVLDAEARNLSIRTCVAATGWQQPLFATTICLPFIIFWLRAGHTVGFGAEAELGFVLGVAIVIFIAASGLFHCGYFIALIYRLSLTQSAFAVRHLDPARTPALIALRKAYDAIVMALVFGFALLETPTLVLLAISRNNTPILIYSLASTFASACIAITFIAVPRIAINRIIVQEIDLALEVIMNGSDVLPIRLPALEYLASWSDDSDLTLRLEVYSHVQSMRDSAYGRDLLARASVAAATISLPYATQWSFSRFLQK